MFCRVLVANRGEIAYRIIKTLKKMGIEAVAVYSEADKDAGYLNEAQKKVFIGPALANLSYLNEDAILNAAALTECDAIHPGFGFLSENARFATRCKQQKLSFIGPNPEHIAMMGDKANAILTMKSLGIPTLPGSNSVVKNVDEAAQIANQIGYPVFLKAKAGGGGKGMRLAQNEKDLENAFLLATNEAKSAFLDGGLYVEKYIANARHIEFQVLGDVFSNVVVFCERECSIQRKNQKLLEETPAFGFSADARLSMMAVIKNALSKIGYVNAGTLEFLQTADGQLYFMEMNTRIQVEHPITELIYGIDLIEWQIKIACQQNIISLNELRPNGVAIECRINAESPKQQFKPTPGIIKECILPESNIRGPVRIDTHIAKDLVISPFYDSMLAKVIVHGDTRDQAIKLMDETLGSMKITGVDTTIDFQRIIVNHPQFKKGCYDCSFLEKNHDLML
jgi:acetyl-CoA carboxylase biotin carboxylase subunit